MIFNYSFSTVLKRFSLKFLKLTLNLINSENEIITNCLFYLKESIKTIIARDFKKNDFLKVFSLISAKAQDKLEYIGYYSVFPQVNTG